MAAYANTDGHGPATPVSPSENPSETESDLYNDHTDLQ